MVSRYGGLLSVGVSLVVPLFIELLLGVGAYEFSSNILPVRSQESGLSHEVAAIATLDASRVIVAIESRNVSEFDKPPSVVLQAVSADNLVAFWSAQSPVRGEVADIAVAQSSGDNEAVVYIALSVQEDRVYQGRLYEVLVNLSNPEPKFILRQTIASSQSHTKIRAIHVENDGRSEQVVFTTGGTLGVLDELVGSVSKMNPGVSDVFVTRQAGITPAKSMQLTSSRVEQGQSLTVNPSKNELLVAVESSTGTAVSSDALLLRLDTGDLSLLSPTSQNPIQVVDSGVTYSQPRSVGYSPQFDDRPNTWVSFVAGKAQVASGRNYDMFCNIHRSIEGAVDALPVYVDGPRRGTDSDEGAAVIGGKDGNAYLVGHFAQESSIAPFLSVVSPTGITVFSAPDRLLSNIERSVRDATLLYELPNGTVIVYSGKQQSSTQDTSQAFVGAIKIFPGEVEPFPGFGDLAPGQSTNEPSPPPSKRTVGLSKTVIICLGAAAGLVVVVLAALILVEQVHRKRRDDKDTGTQRRDTTETIASVVRAPAASAFDEEW